jgi:adenine phosphoribosyltransferase
MSTLSDRLEAAVRNVPDFPKPGIQFKDITPIFYDPALVQDAVQALAEPYRQAGITRVIGIESRGFLLGVLLAQELDCGFVLVRKQGKLPADTTAVSYALEYGEATIEVHTDAIRAGDVVLIHDDLLATGGTAAAAAELVQRCGAQVAGACFVIQLEFLAGAAKLAPQVPRIDALLRY